MSDTNHNQFEEEDIVELARLDERQKRVLIRLDKMDAFLKETNDKISVMEGRLNNLEYLASGQQARWEHVTRYVFQAVWVILLAWALTKLNLPAPPLF